MSEWYGDVEVTVKARRRLCLTKKGKGKPTAEEILAALQGKDSPVSIEDCTDEEDLGFEAVHTIDIQKCG